MSRLGVRTSPGTKLAMKEIEVQLIADITPSAISALTYRKEFMMPK